MPVKINRRSLRLCILVAIVVPAGIGLWYGSTRWPSSGGSGCYQVYRLSNSGIGIRLSRMASFQPNGKLYDGNGIQPDILIEPVVTDFIGRTDTFLDRAIELINSKNISLHL